LRSNKSKQKIGQGKAVYAGIAKQVTSLLLSRF
jgi:hypothetical protein